MYQSRNNRSYYNNAQGDDAGPRVENGDGLPKGELGFDSRTIRARFVRKVFTLVALMLGLVSAMCAVPFVYKVRSEDGLKDVYPMREYLQRNRGLVWIGYAVFFVVYIALNCSKRLRRHFPTNYICLAIYTLAMGFMTTIITSVYSLNSVLMAAAITTVCCTGVAAFAALTKRDLTTLLGFAFIITLVLVLFGLVAVVAVLIFHTQILMVVYAAAGALIFMLWLAIDIQIIMGGREQEVSEEDHVAAAMELFLDIVQIFWFILRLVGE